MGNNTDLIFGDIKRTEKLILWNVSRYTTLGFTHKRFGSNLDSLSKHAAAAALLKDQKKFYIQNYELQNSFPELSTGYIETESLMSGYFNRQISVISEQTHIAVFSICDNSIRLFKETCMSDQLLFLLKAKFGLEHHTSLQKVNFIKNITSLAWLFVVRALITF